jgi:hypothetical protein
MAWFDPATSYAGGGLDRETGQNIPAALWQRLMDSLTAIGGTTGRRLALRREWAKGADIASAATVALGTDGNYFDITGTTTITAITALNAGTRVLLQFDGALKVTHATGANNPILFGAQDFYSVAGSWLELVSDGTNFREVARGHGTAAALYATADLGGDVTLTTAGTYYDGPSISLSPGTWFIIGKCTSRGPTIGDEITTKLWDGSTVFDSADHTTPVANHRFVDTLSAVVVVTAAATVKLSTSNLSNNGGSILAAAAGVNKSSTLRAHRIA